LRFKFRLGDVKVDDTAITTLLSAHQARPPIGTGLIELKEVGRGLGIILFTEWVVALPT